MLVYDCSWRHAGGDARSLLAYFFAKQHGIMSANRLYADACARLYQSAEFVPDFMADQFAAIMKREPFAFRILTHQLGDLVLERAKGFEPSTPTLARSCSTPELHPHPLDIWPIWHYRPPSPNL